MRPALGPVAAKLKIVPFSPFRPPVPAASLPAYRRVASQLLRWRLRTLGASATFRFAIGFWVCTRHRNANVPYSAPISVFAAITVNLFPALERVRIR